MASMSADFMGRNRQKILIPKTIGEAFADVVRRLLGNNLSELIKRLDMDRKTVVNLRDGKAGATVLANFLAARRASTDDAWDVVDAIFEQVLGESRDDYDARKVRELIETTENARSLHEARRARRAALAERASFAADALRRPRPRQDGRGAG
jgi:hypothetical protein